MPEDFDLANVTIVEEHGVLSAPVEFFDSTNPSVHTGAFMIVPVVIILN